MELPIDSDPVAKEVLQNGFVLITYNKIDSLILIKWKRQITFEERKEVFLWALQYSIDNDVKNWLIDDEEIFIITSEEREWITNEWTQMVAGSCIKKIAVYIPDYYYSALTTQTDFTENAKKNYKKHGTAEHEVFTDYQTAMTWIKS